MGDTCRKRILISGISGLLGNNLAYAWRENYDILGLYHEHRVAIDGVRIEPCDLLDDNKIKKILGRFEPEFIIHCAALSNIDVCEENQALAREINVVGTQKLLENMNSPGMKFVYISTDNLYGEGKEALLDEDSPVEPLNYYGMTKWLAEKAVLRNKNALVLRTNIFGWNIQDKHSLSEWFLHELQNHNPFPGFNDVFFSSIYTLDFAEILEKALGKDLKGVYNLGSRTAMTKYNFAKNIAEILDLDPSLIQPTSIDDVGLRAKRRKRLALNVSKMQSALGVTFPTMEQSIKRFCRDYKEGIQKKIVCCVYPTQDTIPYGRQKIDENDIQAVSDVLRAGNLTQGGKIGEFEQKLQSVTGARFCAAVNSGTAALHLACLAIGVKKGDEVITSPNSFVASANCITYCGGKPVFADIDLKTYNISVSEIEKKINKNTRAVIPVHFAGQSCDMEGIYNLVRRKEKEYGTRIYIIEDASHALGSVYHGKAVGSCLYSDVATMSFHPVKHITTAEGGAVLTNDERLIKKIRICRSHGITGDLEDMEFRENAFEGSEDNRNTWYYEQQFLGYNYRITDVQCALGISQLDKLPAFIKRRREIVDYYNRIFSDVPYLQLPYESERGNSNFHLYVLLIDFTKIGKTRNRFMQQLWSKKIRTQVHYIPIYTQPFYRKYLNVGWGLCPNAEKYYAQCLSIPLYPAMSMDDVETVVKAITQVIRG